MPTRPPRIGGAPKRPAWAPSPAVATKRKRGRAGCRDRAQVRAEEPLCRECLKEGRATPTAIVDHIRPLAWGGSDARSNKQGLCKRHHDEKSAAERLIDAEQRRR
jgi:5-methylcytosine-specific restriction enzyme A